VSLRLLGLLLPLALDTFAISALLATAGLTAERRRLAGAVFVGFETAMPLVGLGLGLGSARVIGESSEWVALACIAAVGAWLLVEDEQREAKRAWAVVGFTFGLLEVSVGVAVALIAAQALVASQLGFRVGARLGTLATVAERGAGVALIAISALLLVARLL
jgi:putative Mn2+ efflux pump MntP